MEKVKISRKDLAHLVNNSMREAISKLELPKATKKLEKLIAKSSKKIASEFSELIKKEHKKAKKAQKEVTYIEDVLADKKKGKKKKARTQAENA